MDIFAITRMLGALAVVLGMLGAALWIVKRFNVRLPGRIGGAPARRIEIVEQLAIDPRRSLLLLRRDGEEHLVLMSPEGHLVVKPAREPREAEPAAAPAIPPYAELMTQAIERMWARLSEEPEARAPLLRTRPAIVRHA